MPYQREKADYRGRAVIHAQSCKTCLQKRRVQFAVTEYFADLTGNFSEILDAIIAAHGHIMGKDINVLLSKDKGAPCKYLVRHAAWKVRTR